MGPYEILLEDAARLGLIVKEMHFHSKAHGILKGDRIGINISSTTPEKTCALVEEIKHFRYTVGDILNQKDLRNRKQERFARGRAYRRLVPLDAFVEAFLAGISGRHEIAEFMEVTEPFLDEAVTWYRDKYGLCIEVDEYIISFDPLAVAIMFK